MLSALTLREDGTLLEFIVHYGLSGFQASNFSFRFMSQAPAAGHGRQETEEASAWTAAEPTIAQFGAQEMYQV